jgi:hypothetical protein
MWLVKLTTKTLVNKMKLLLPSIISPQQNCFMLSRRINDNVIVAQKVINSMHKLRRRKGFMAIKVDLEKACDCLSWNFVQDSGGRCRFPSWIRWDRNTSKRLYNSVRYFQIFNQSLSCVQLDGHHASPATIDRLKCNQIFGARNYSATPAYNQPRTSHPSVSETLSPPPSLPVFMASSC